MMPEATGIPDENIQRAIFIRKVRREGGHQSNSRTGFDKPLHKWIPGDGIAAHLLPPSTVRMEGRSLAMPPRIRPGMEFQSIRSPLREEGWQKSFAISPVQGIIFQKDPGVWNRYVITKNRFKSRRLKRGTEGCWILLL
jgi:hypothetical protein